MSPGADAGGFVDEFEPLRLQAAERFREIGDPVGDVVKALAPFLQEATDGGIGRQGLEKFDGPDEEDPDTLRREVLHRGTRVLGHELEERTGLLQGGDGHGNVVQRVGEHVFFGALVRSVGTHGDA